MGILKVKDEKEIGERYSIQITREREEMGRGNSPDLKMEIANRFFKPPRPTYSSLSRRITAYTLTKL